MPSKEELRERLHDARLAKSAAEESIKRLADLQVPEQARADKKRLVKRLRRIARRMARHIPVLRKRIAAKRKSGGEKAAAWALKQIGTTESPTGSNKGPYPISHCQIFTIGYDGVPWCGCFVASAAVEEAGADIPLKARLAYTPYVCADAAANTNGLRRISADEVERGDLIVFNFGSGIAKHVGLALGPIAGGMTDCAEGNTSSGTSGSQDNGGGVYRRSRPLSDVICFARPDYR